MGVEAQMNKNKTYPVYLAFGALILYLALFLGPGLIGIGYSFTDWSSYSRELNFVGLENFRQILSPQNEYLGYIGNTLTFTVATILLKTVLGMAFALILTGRVIGRNIHRAVLFLPSVLSLVVTGLIFRSIMNPATGLLNKTLEAVGLGVLAQKWLVDPNIALGSIVGVDVWRGTGYIMCILIAGLTSVDPSYYEAARIDGANGWQSFRSITLPLIMPSLTVTTVLNMIYGLKVFDIVYVLTNGGPGHVTEVLYSSVYKQFSQGKYALGTAMSSLMFVIMVIAGYFVIRLMTREEVGE